MCRLLFLLFVASCATTQNIRKSPELLLREADQLAEERQFKEAIALYRSLLTKYPDHLIAKRNLGIILIKAGDFEAGLRHLTAVVGELPQNFETNFYLGEGHRGLNQLKDALFYYQSAYRLDPNNGDCVKALAWVFFKIRFYSEAYNMIKPKLAQNPLDEEFLIIYAKTLLKLKRYPEALKVVRKSITKLPQNLHPLFFSLEGDIFYALKKSSKAEERYRASLKAEPLLMGSLLGLGKIRLEEGRTTEAISYLERGLRLKPKHHETLFYLAKAYEKINLKKSLTYYESFRENAEFDPECSDLINTATKRLSELSPRPSSG